MKKIFALVLGMLIVLSMAACGTEADNKTTAPDHNLVSSGNDTQTSDNAMSNQNNEGKNDLLPELVPDGEYSVNLNQEKVIYDSNGIKVTYTGIAFNVGLSDELYFRVENNTDGYICFMPNSVVINGMSLSVSNSSVTAANTTETVAAVFSSADRETLIASAAEIKCFDLTFSILKANDEYGTSGTAIVNGDTVVFAEGQHDHRNDSRTVKGELVFENEEVELYIDKNITKKDDKLYSNYTVINKTGDCLCFANQVECRYEIAPARPHYTVAYDMNEYLSPNSYFTGSFYIDDEHSTLEMNEIIFTLKGYKATQLDQTVTFAVEDLAQFSFFGTTVSLKGFSISK